MILAPNSLALSKRHWTLSTTITFFIPLDNRPAVAPKPIVPAPKTTTF